MYRVKHKTYNDNYILTGYYPQKSFMFIFWYKITDVPFYSLKKAEKYVEACKPSWESTVEEN